jgi:hypothetical protein
MIYTGIYDFFTKKLIAIDGQGIGTIPLDTANTDYQKYLEWVEEGNTPLPTDSE